MKKTIIFLLAIFFSATIFSQKDKEVTLTSFITISVVDLSETHIKLDEFLKTIDVLPSEYNVSTRKIYLDISLSKEHHFELNAKLKEWGYILEEKTEANYFQDKILKINREIGLLEKRKNQYKVLVSKLDSTMKEKFFEYSEKIIEIDKDIAEYTFSKDDISAKNITYNNSITIKEESRPGSDYDDNWINMPGMEYSYLQVEQPVEGVNPKIMHGVGLKYLFNTKKSYALLGLYKTYEENTETEINEIYIFAFGQDFYSKRMGRGERKFLNLYTSFNTGLYVASSEDSKATSWFVNPYLGLEIFKTNNIILDNKFGYFLPFKDNRTQRGLLYNLSFNFVF